MSIELILFSSVIVSTIFLILLAVCIFYLIKFFLQVDLPVLKLSNESLLSIIAVFSFIFVSGWYWDGWWHVTFGRDRFFSPPHIGVYLYLLFFFIGTLYLYKREKSGNYKYALWAEAITLYSGIVDIFWHGHFGVEKLISPLIIWSPPHLVGFFATLASMLCILIVLLKKYKKDQNPLSFFKIVLLSGSTISIISIITSPLQPLSWHHILGVWGVAITIFFGVFFLIFMVHRLPKSGIATLTMLILIVFIGFEAKSIAPGLELPPHPNTPQWLHFLAALLAVIWIDFILIKKNHSFIIGGVSGLIMTSIYAIFFKFVNTPSFSYTGMDGMMLIISGSVGGLCAGLTYDWIKRKSKWKL